MGKVWLVLSSALLVGVTACGSSNQADSTGRSTTKAIAVKADDTSCVPSTTDLSSGTNTFQFSNSGTQIAELYVYAEGDRVMGEVENVGPSTSRTLVVDLPAGRYELACKAGMIGKGVRQSVNVSGISSAALPVDTELANGVSAYRTFVESEASALVDTTATFVTAVKAGDLAGAKRNYANARLHYERIEPIAESFGDLDPLIDMRIDDATDGLPFVGFHRLERDIWQDGNIAGSGLLAADLQTNVMKLAGLVKTVEITPLTMSNGAKSLLDEVAKSKVTGEEERYSHIDLVDFAGNVDGSKAAYTQLRPVVVQKTPDLAKTLDNRFASMQTALESHVAGGSYVSYSSLSESDIKVLANEVDAISEPLGQLTAVITQPA